MVIGISGGIDSSVVAALAVKALRPTSVLGLLMPEEGVTPKEDTDDAVELATKLSVPYRLIEIGQKKLEIMKDLTFGLFGSRKSLGQNKNVYPIFFCLSYENAGGRNNR